MHMKQVDEDVVSKVEQYAVEVVDLVRELIDQSRNINWKDSSLACSSSSTKSSRPLQDTEESFYRICKKDFEPKVRVLSQRIIELHVPDQGGFWNSTLCEPEEDLVDQVGGGVWTFVVYQVLYPLLNNLGRCYQVLDDLPQQQEKRRQQNGDKPPKPPPGMLSIQNYMDIAVLLEFTVCISILPLLDDQVVLGSVEQRLQSIPKTLRGRTPISAILQAAQQRHQVKNNPVQRHAELVYSCILIGNLIYLQRFRPMFLPRHLTDVYAGILQAENLETMNNHNDYKPMPAFQRLQSTLFQDEESLSFAKARAFQQLLVQSRVGWLRERVSFLLDQLAVAQLESIISVFVYSVAMADKSSAALRLAQALTRPNKTKMNHSHRNTQYFTRLAQQLVVVLDSCVLRSMEEEEKKSWSEHEAVTLDFIWMTLHHLTDDILVKEIFQPLLDPLVRFTNNGETTTTTTTSIHRSVLRMEKLFSCVPYTAVNGPRFCQLLLSFRPNCEIALLPVLLRLACTKTVLVNPVKVAASRALRSIVKFLSCFMFSVQDSTEVEGVDVAAVSLMYSLIPTPWDLAGVQFQFHGPINSQHEEGAPFSSVTVEVHSQSFDLNKMMDDMHCYMEHVGREVILPLASENKETTSMAPNSDSVLDVPSRMLELLLRVYLRRDPQNSVLLLTTMVATPLLCEICPLELLVSSSSGQFRLLGIMRIVFESLWKLRDGEPHGTAEESYTDAERLVGQWIPLPPDDMFGLEMNDFLVAQVGEFGTSVGCGLLNILAWILELGEKKRTQKEEGEIQSLMPSLTELAQVRVGVHGMDPGQWSEIGEAASHILSLLALRGQTQSTEIPSHDDPMSSRLHQAKQDLKSREPPLRARGVFSLRQIILSGELKKQARVTLVSEADGLDGDSDQNCNDIMDEIFLLLLEALSDEESYVYLGAIHTLAIMASDLHFFTVILGAIAHDTLVVKGQQQTVVLQQRVKLTEVAITVLRRSPAILADRASLVLDVLIYGKTERVRPGDHTESLEIHKKTREFLEGTWTQDDTGVWEEKKIRLNTGGPLFATEEPDLIRSGWMDLVTEVVVLGYPCFRHCASLVDCVILSLTTLESSRPISRSAARLAWALYVTVVDEMEQLIESLDKKLETTTCPMTWAMMIQAKEDVLASMLKQLALTSPDGATCARCQEALMEREIAEQGGIFAAVHLAISKKRADNPFLVKLLASNKTLKKKKQGKRFATK